jgi:predicted nucleotidyltransferase
MRLTPDQHDTIMRVVRDHAGEGAAVFLYGSRVQDDRRGGDVDLLVQASRAIVPMQQSTLHARLEEALRLPVDISFIDARRGMTRFQKMAAAQALPLGTAR